MIFGKNWNLRAIFQISEEINIHSSYNLLSYNSEEASELNKNILLRNLTKLFHETA